MDDAPCTASAPASAPVSTGVSAAAGITARPSGACGHLELDAADTDALERELERGYRRVVATPASGMPTPPAL